MASLRIAIGGKASTSVVLDHRAKTEVYARFLNSDYSGLINCHSHPFAAEGVSFSNIDDSDDLREFSWFYEQAPRAKARGGVHALSMVFGQKSIDARGYVEGNRPAMPAVDLVQVIDEPLRLIVPTSSGKPTPSSREDLELYDRQIATFGSEAQEQLANLSVGLVGAGGIGSIFAESVLRLGVRRLLLVDGDSLELSNLNRWQGGTPGDIGKPKAEILSHRLRTLFPDASVISIVNELQSKASVGALKTCDLILGAVDNHLARYFLNRIAVQYLIPYIDAATVIGRNDGELLGLKARVAIVVPGVTACLDCSRIRYYDKREVTKQLYDPETQSLLRKAGYLKDLPGIKAPAVLPLNMLASSAALFEVINLVAGYAPLARYIWFDWLHLNGMTNRTDSANFPEPPSLECLFCNGYLGQGDTEPFEFLKNEESSFTLSCCLLRRP